MTCIVALKDKGKVWMGGDSAGVSGYSISKRLDKKVFVKNNMIMGFTSSFRMGQLLQYKLVLPKHNDNVHVFQYMTTDFIDAVRECLRAGGFAEKEKEAEKGGQFLVGYRGKIFHVFDDYQVAEHDREFDACGAGAEYALGSLYNSVIIKSPKERVRQALRTAVYFSAAVCKPFIILSK